LPVLAEVATATAPEHQQAPLRRALEQAVTFGDAVILLDGLDECREQRGAIADGLARVLDQLPPDTGIVLATRASGLSAARRLALPEARLISPSGLDSSFPGALLRHVADHNAVPEAERAQWVREREQKLDDIRRSHPDLWQVPLLATLLTLLAAGRETAMLPASRARLLTDAVEDTVRRWELARMPGTAVFPDLRGDQLLSGYSEIAHAILAGPGSRPPAIVQQMVVGMLASQWGKAPAEAGALAREIMQFWDGHVGVFVTSPVTGYIEPRSRVFAEIGEAMWMVRQDPDTRRDQIAAALADQDNREPVVLAAILSADVASELIDAAGAATIPASGTHALLWAADAIIDGAAPEPASLGKLLDGLALAARQAGAPPTTGADLDGGAAESRSLAALPEWPYALRVATLPLPAELRPARDSALAGLALDENAKVLAAALAVLANARTDSSITLSPDQTAAVRQLLDRPLPDRKPAVPQPASPQAPIVLTSGRGTLLPGHQLAAELAATYAAQLGTDAAAAMYRIAHRGSFNGYWRIRDRLAAAGYDDPEPSGVHQAVTGLAEQMGYLWDDLKAFFESAASLDAPRALSRAERWRCPHIAALANVLDVRNASLDGIDHAFTTDQALLPRWIRAVAHAADLDTPALAAEATVVLEAWATDRLEIISIMFAPPPTAGPELDASRLDHEDHDALTEAQSATSDWMASIASALLVK
jgi:hypothetical protein